MRCLFGMLLIALFVLNSSASAHVLRVPDDYPSVQQAIDAAASGDTVLVAPGTYRESLLLDKSIVLASWFLTSRDSSYIGETVLDGNGGETVIRISGTHADTTVVTGFTIRNGEDGVSPSSPFQLLHNRIMHNVDGIDFASGTSGIIQFNRFDLNADDGIDLDGAIDVLIEHNIIKTNRDDGIEVRLQPYSGPILHYVIRGNRILLNGEDGIQIIDYPGVSDRILTIERNLILSNAMAGIGCMGDAKTKENFEGAQIPEPIRVTNNIFDGNPYGISGGGNMQVENNIFVRSAVVAVSNVNGRSVVRYNGLWHNTKGIEGSQVEERTIIQADPMFDGNHALRHGSPYTDAGTPDCRDEDGTRCDIGL